MAFFEPSDSWTFYDPSSLEEEEIEVTEYNRWLDSWDDEPLNRRSRNDIFSVY